MKRKPTAYILLLVTACALLAGCGRSVSDADRLLARIDSLADVDPDSADVLLKPTPSPSMKGREKEEVALLLRIKVDDKLYRPVTHYRDTILQLVSYFEQHPKVLPSVLGSTGPALPYLYAGRIFADLGDAPQALDYYQRALDAQPAGQMENGKLKIENKDVRRLAKQRGLLHSFIGTLFSYQNLYDEALKHYKAANRWAMTARDTIDVIFNLRDIAEQYKFLAKYDSSLYFYHKSSDYAVKLGWKRKHNELRTQMASVYIRKDDYAKALQLIWPSLHDVDTLNITSTYGVASKIYEHLGILDSAYYCYEKLLKYGNLYGKSYAHKKMAERAFKENRLQEMYHHLMLYNESADTIRERKNAEVSSRMHAAYNYQKHEREAHELRLSNAMKEKVIYVTILSLILLLVVVLWLRSMLKIHKTKLEESRRVHEDLQRKFSLLTEDYEKKLEQANLRLKESTDEEERNALTQQRDQILYHTTLSRLEKEKIEAKTRSIHATELFKKILSTPSYLRSTKGAWSDVEKIISEHYPEFMDHLSQLLPKLSEKERQVSLLLKAHIGHQTIADIICETQNGESNIRRRLCKKVFPKETPSSSKFDDFIYSL